MPVAVAGASPDLLGIQSEPLDRPHVDRFLADAKAGAVLVFEGVVRDHHDGRPVHHLEYETYQEMAMRQIAAIAAAMRGNWPLARIAIVHRVGRLEIGEAAVIVGVSSAHRAEAFEACRFGIDQVKADVAIWKREFYADGTAAWQDNHC